MSHLSQLVDLLEIFFSNSIQFLRTYKLFTIVYCFKYKLPNLVVFFTSLIFLLLLPSKYGHKFLACFPLCTFPEEFLIWGKLYLYQSESLLYDPVVSLLRNLALTSMLSLAKMFMFSRAIIDSSKTLETKQIQTHCYGMGLVK